MSEESPLPAPTPLNLQHDSVGGIGVTLAENHPAFDSDDDDEEGGGADAGMSTPEPEQKEFNLFVGNVDYKLTEDDIGGLFSSAGEVVRVSMPVDFQTGNTRGFGFVSYATLAEAEKAVETLNGEYFSGRELKVQFSVAAKPPHQGGTTPSSTLFVGNLPFHLEEDALWDVFGEFGAVKGVRLVTDRGSGRFKGYGYVEFHDEESASTAHKKMVGKEIDGRNIRIDFAEERKYPPRGAGFGSGQAMRTCYTCGQPGHMSRDCPKGKGSGRGRDDGNRVCFNCGEEGHMSYDCPERGGRGRGNRRKDDNYN